MTVGNDYEPNPLERRIYNLLKQRYARSSTEFTLSAYGFVITRPRSAPNMYRVVPASEPLGERSTTRFELAYNLPVGSHAPDAPLEALIGVQADIARYAEQTAKLLRLGYRGSVEIREENPILRTTYEIATPTRRTIYSAIDMVLPKNHVH